MLASIAIEHLVNSSRGQQHIGVTYIFCDYKMQNEQTAQALIANLLKQLLQHKLSIPEHIRRMYERLNNGSKDVARPTLDEVFESLLLIAASFSQVYIVIDALDELQQHARLLPTLLSKLSALQARSPLNLTMTSRDIPRVTEQVQYNVRLEVCASNEDVERYVSGHLDELPKFVSKSPKMQQTIKDAIVSAVDGMYVHFKLYYRTLTLM